MFEKAQSDSNEYQQRSAPRFRLNLPEEATYNVKTHSLQNAWKKGMNFPSSFIYIHEVAENSFDIFYSHIPHPVQINFESFPMGYAVCFWNILDQKPDFKSFGRESKCPCFLFSKRSSVQYFGS